MKQILTGRRRKILLGAGLLLTLVAWSFARPYRPLEPLPEGIVDLHCHVAGIGAGNSGCFVSKQLHQSWRFRVYLRSFDVTEADVLKHGDRIIADRVSASLARSQHVRKAVLLALDGVVDGDGQLDTGRTEVYVPNSFVADAVARHTNLLFGASVNPHRRDALEQLVWAREHGAVLVKWIPSIMEIDPADPRLIPFYEKLVEMDLPLLTHGGNEHSFSRSSDAFCDPERLRLPLSLGVKVIVAHIASTGRFHGERSTDRLAGLMREYPNLYSDISSLTQLNKRRYLKEALARPEFAGRLMYGSDFPLIKTGLVSPWYYPFRLSLRQILAIRKLGNAWDGDVALKQQLGTPADIFTRSQALTSSRNRQTGAGEGPGEPGGNTPFTPPR